jgi:Family of unknown function (DUF6221)
MMDLTAFVTARLDEREHFAKIVRLAQKHRDQMLREVEADRRLIAAWKETLAVPAAGEQADQAGWRLALELALKLRASVWSDHPGYRQEWKP